MRRRAKREVFCQKTPKSSHEPLCRERNVAQTTQSHMGINHARSKSVFFADLDRAPTSQTLRGYRERPSDPFSGPTAASIYPG